MALEETTRESSEEDMAVEVRLEMGEADSPAMFSNFMGVQYHEGSFVLTFGQLIPPLIIGSPAERKDYFRATGSITIRPVAKIVLTPDKARDVVETLQRHIQRNTAEEEANESDNSDSEE